MTKPVSELHQNTDYYLLQNLEQLSQHTHNTINLVRSNSSCEDIFEQFNKIKKAANHAESLLITSQLKNCLLKSIPLMEEIFSTLKILSSNRYGALIVIEREDDVENIINKNNLGVLLDAMLSRQLLESIFYPGTPLHDGAVIIRKERIFSAGCVLPLTKQTVSRKKLGTRHRAALGLSEICDAIIFVVSEETRNISIAFKGELLLVEKISDISDFLKH